MDLVGSLTNLQSLDLTDNDISVVQPAVMATLPKLIHFSLAGKFRHFKHNLLRLSPLCLCCCKNTKRVSDVQVRLYKHIYVHTLKKRKKEGGINRPDGREMVAGNVRGEEGTCQNKRVESSKNR